MEYLKNLYYNNKYLFYSIIASIVLVIGIIVYFLIPSNSSKSIDNPLTYQLVLFGESEIVIYKDDIYQEIGYYATLNNEMVTDLVIVNNLVDTSKVGTYEITYQIGNIKKTRIVKVIENPNVSINDITFELIGDSTITLVKGEKYQEFGVKAVDKNNNNIASKVVITGSVDSNKEGTYTIIYSLTINGETKTLKRVVEVSNKNEEIKFYLLGNSTITLKNGEKYQEPGYLAYDKDNNNIKNKVVVSGNVNTNIAGTYVITYTLNIDLETKILKRTVIVSSPVVKEELKINLSYSKNYTNKDVVVSIMASGTDYSYLKLPNGQTVSSKTTTYSVSSNGTYTFYAYDKAGNYKSQTITINNIDKTKPTATCTAKSYSNKTEITVKAQDNLGIDRYVYNGSYSSKLNTYTINSKLNTVSVLVYDLVGNMTEVDCSLSLVKGLWVAHMKNRAEYVDEAIKEGFWGIEVDVRQSGDIFKLYHDSSNDPYRGYNLDVFLDTCKANNITAVLDLKKVNDYDKLISLVKSKNMQNNTIYQTSVGNAKNIYNIDSNARIWVLISDSNRNISGSVLKQLQDVKDYVEGINMLALNVDSNDISTVQSLGLTFCAFSYKSKLYSNANASTLRKWGSDYIMANNIDDN